MTEQTPAADLPEPVAPVADDSLKAAIQAARERARQSKTKDIELPDFGAITMKARYRPLTWKETKAVTRENANVPEDLRELYVAADSLIRASLDIVAVIDGVERPLGLTHGLSFARWLSTEENPSVAETDRQAVLTEIFLNEGQLMGQYGLWMVWQQGVNLAADEETKGNFVAAS